MARQRFRIPRDRDGWSVLQFLERTFSGGAAVLGRAGLVTVNGRPCRDLRLRLRPGDTVHVETSSAKRLDPRGKDRPVPRRQGPQGRRPRGKEDNRERRSNAPRIDLRFQDEHILVVDKPADLTTVRHRGEIRAMGTRASKHLPSTLVDLLMRQIPARQRRGRIRAVHRLDKETSGLVVLALTAEAESKLGKQFRAHTIERRYLALVRGRAEDRRIESRLSADRGDGRRGSLDASDAQRAVTHVRVVERLADFTLVECRLETGRTHQVRIHLGEQGWPLCGETVYDRPLHGAPLPDASGAQRPMLHAAHLAIDHPATGERLTWDSALPRDMEELLARLQRLSSARR